MRVLHLGTTDRTGGAATAMYRWHTSLRKLGVESEILCLNKSVVDDNVSVVLPNCQDPTAMECAELQRFFIESNRTAYSGTFFSHPLGSVSVADHELVRGADVVHVHWTSLFFDWREIRRIRSLGKSVVLTPHDLWAVTGGCHYPKDCDGYLKQCLNCPMLKEDPFQLISSSRALKQGIIADSVDLVLSPSHWMDRVLSNIETLKLVRAGVIPYCVDTSQFRDEPKERSKEEIGFQPRGILVLFCADYVTEGRKGLNHFAEVLKICETRADLRKIFDRHVEFAMIGKGSDRVEVPTTFPVHGRGYISTAEELRRFYCASDLLVYLGLEDNLPNVILESMACGTPPLAFNTGGVGDMIEDGVNGHLVPRSDAVGFAERLGLLLSDTRKLSRLGMNARQKTLNQFSEGVIGLELRRLYETLGRWPREFARPKSPTFDESAFQDAVQRTIRMVMGKEYRLMAQECDNLRARLSKDEEEMRVLRSQLIELGADLERERQRSLWDRFKEKLTRLAFDIARRS